jgi:archaeal type IV pilus assembly protein PilA
MKTTTLKPKELKTSHRAVAPVIATLLMVAIAVVGGTIIFVFSQGFFSSSQISGTPTIEAVKILGYDARAVADLQADDGNVMASGGAGNSAGDGDPNVQQDERIAVYLTNDSVQKIVIAELSFGGTVYNYTTITANTLDDYTGGADLIPGTYAVLTGTPNSMLSEGAAEIKAGETVTVIIDLDSDLRVGRGTQFKLTTTNGGTFVSTVNVGQQAG